MHLAYIWIVFHLSAKNYQNWCKFDEVLTKTNLLSFFGTRCTLYRMVTIRGRLLTYLTGGTFGSSNVTRNGRRCDIAASYLQLSRSKSMLRPACWLLCGPRIYIFYRCSRVYNCEPAIIYSNYYMKILQKNSSGDETRT